MKKTVTTFIVLTTLLMSCKDTKKANSKDNDPDENIVLQEEQVTDELPNPSDYSFVAALDEYQNGNYEKAADFIENGVIELREEEKTTEDLDGLLLDTEIEKIRSLAEKVRTNKIENLNVLTQAMANAEMLVAHDYIIYTISTLLEETVKGTYYFSKAMSSLNNAILHLKGKAKEEAVAIRNQSKALAGKIKDGSENLEPELKIKLKKLRHF